MDLIIRICRSGLLLAAMATLMPASPLLAAYGQKSELDQYVDARLSEIASDDAAALKSYLTLFGKQSDSEVLADRVFAASLRLGYMDNAVRAVRAQELHGQTSGEASLLLFADAFRKKNWSMARVAAAELELRSDFGFMTPILRGWMNVAQGNEPGLPISDPEADPVFAYYAFDQRVYFDLAMGKYDSAIAGIGGLVGVDEEFARDLAIRSAPIYAAHGRPQIARALLEQAVERDYAADILRIKPSDALASLSPTEGLSAMHVRIAQSLLAQGNEEKALVFARIGSWLAPKSDAATLVLAQSLATQGLTNEASNALQSVASYSAYWPRALAEQVKLLIIAGKQDAAVKLALSAHQARPNSESLALVLAQAQEQTDNKQSAAEIYQQLINRADNARAPVGQRSQYRLFLATLEDARGDWTKARKLLEEAKVIDPQNSYILNYLGYTLLEKREEKLLGLELVRKAYLISPESVAITDSLGWGYFLAGDYGKAVELLEKAVRAAGNDLTINEHMGDAYWLSGRFVDARYAWRIATQTASDADTERLAGKIDHGLGRGHIEP